MKSPERYVFDDRSDVYRLGGDMLAGIARAEYGIETDDASLERWRQLVGIMRDFDTRADDFGLTRRQAIDELNDFTVYEDVYPELTRDELGDQVFNRLVSRVNTILLLGERAATTASVGVYVQVRVAEALHTVRMIDDVTLPQTRSQAEYSDFIDAVSRLGEAATLLDSLVDGRKDFHTQKQALEPNREYYRNVAQAMYPRGRANIHSLLHREPLAELAKVGASRVVNRMRYGVPEYSTMRSFQRSARGTIETSPDTH